MRSFRGAVWALGIGVGIGMGANSADAKSVFRWETDEGVVSFADEMKRVPKRYRDGVKKINTNALTSAKRFTEIATPAKAGHADQVAGRLETLREFNGTVGAAPVTLASGVTPRVHPVSDVALKGLRRRGNGTETRIQSFDQVVPTLHFGAEADSDAPVVVEKIRVRDDTTGANLTRQITVIRQGEKILAVIKPTPRRSYGLDFPNESDFEVTR